MASGKRDEKWAGFFTENRPNIWVEISREVNHVTATFLSETGCEDFFGK
jgi:hypothetical protein